MRRTEARDHSDPQYFSTMYLALATVSLLELPQNYIKLETVASRVALVICLIAVNAFARICYAVQVSELLIPVPAISCECHASVASGYQLD